MKTKFQFRSSRGDEAQIEGSQRLLTSSATAQSAASGLSSISGQQLDAIVLANGRPVAFGGQKKPKLEPNIVKSDLEFIRSRFEITKSESHIIKSDLEITKSDSDITRSEPDIAMFDLNITKSELKIIRSGFDITKSKCNLTMSDLKITKSESDIAKSKLDIIKSVSDFVRKMVKNRHLAAKRLKTGRFKGLARQNSIFVGAEVTRLKLDVRASLRRLLLVTESANARPPHIVFENFSLCRWIDQPQNTKMEIKKQFLKKRK
jgi:hypothetical protein